MRVNSRVFTERMDMFDSIKISNCPSQFKVVAENIMDMATKPGYSLGDYNTMTDLDKKLMLDYWREYDGFFYFHTDEINEYVWCEEETREWFIKKSTPPDLITRARRWLVEHNYLILKPSVLEYAIGASDKWRQSIGK